MHISKLTKMAAAVSLAAALSACGAGGNGDNNGGNNNASGKTADELCAEAASRPGQTTLDAVQVTLCDALDNTALEPVNNVIAGLIEDTPLSELFDRLNELLSPSGELAPVNELIQALIGANGNGALTPVIGGLNAVLIGLLSGDPEAIAAALQGFGDAAGGGSGGNGGPTGTPLDALLALGGESNPLTALLGQLPGAGGGTDGGTDDGLITNVQDLLNNLTGGTPLIEVANLVDTLLNPQQGALAPLTEALEDLTMVDGGPLGPVTELVGALISANDAALAPLIVALNEILVGLLTNQDPAAIAAALQGLAGNLGGGDNPLAGLLPGLPSEGTPGAGNDGLITSVQELVDNLLGDTVLAPVQDLVNTLVDPASGALSPLTGVVNDITSSEEALGQVTALVDMLIAQDDAALAPVIEGLNGVLSLGGITGGGAGLPGLDNVDQLNAIPVIGPILSGLLGGLLGGLPI